MKLIMILILLIVGGCAKEDRAASEFEEYREKRTERSQIEDIVSEKRDHYTDPFGEITFTGEAEDFSNVFLEVPSNGVTFGMPRYYEFIEQEDGLVLNVRILEGNTEDASSVKEVEESLNVDAIKFDEGTYIIEAEAYTFELHMYEESVKRLKDDSGELLRPTRYIPEEATEQWYNEAREEVKSDS